MTDQDKQLNYRREGSLSTDSVRFFTHIKALKHTADSQNDSGEVF